MIAGEVGRAFTLTPSGARWLLDLRENGQSMGGGSFAVDVDEDGFDAGYQDAIEEGEDWVRA